MSEKYFIMNEADTEIVCASTDMDGIMAALTDMAVDEGENIEGYRVLKLTHYPRIKAVEIDLRKVK